MQRKLIVAAFALALTAATPAFCQGNGLQELLTGASTPATLKLKSLNSNWRRVTLDAPGDAKSNPLGQMMGGIMGMFMGGANPPVVSPPYYTQGKTVTLGGETFLVTYRPAVKGLDMGALMKAGNGGGLPAPEKMTAESNVTLQLLNVRSINSISEIRPFNLEQELADSAKAAADQAAFLKEMQQGVGGIGGLGAAPAAPPAEAPTKKPAKPKPGI